MLYSKELCNYIVANEQKDLDLICESFSDNITHPDENTFFLQSSILERIMKNISAAKKNSISLNTIYKGLTEQDLEVIKPLDLEAKIVSQTVCCNILNISYFNLNLFIETIDEQLKTISSKYNLRADDDYNKLFRFLSAIKLGLQSSDNALVSLTNQYKFYKEHSFIDENSNLSDEYITIYGKKVYKVTIINLLIENYMIKMPSLLNTSKNNLRG